MRRQWNYGIAAYRRTDIGWGSCPAFAGAVGRCRKFLERAKAKDAADPFIDREGYLRYIDSAEESFRKLIKEH